jgi:hypothetical protein
MQQTVQCLLESLRDAYRFEKVQAALCSSDNHPGQLPVPVGFLDALLPLFVSTTQAHGNPRGGMASINERTIHRRQHQTPDVRCADVIVLRACKSRRPSRRQRAGTRGAQKKGYLVNEKQLCGDVAIGSRSLHDFSVLLDRQVPNRDLGVYRFSLAPALVVFLAAAGGGFKLFPSSRRAGAMQASGCRGKVEVGCGGGQ